MSASVEELQELKEFRQPGSRVQTNNATVIEAENKKPVTEKGDGAGSLSTEKRHVSREAGRLRHEREELREKVDNLSAELEMKEKQLKSSRRSYRMLKEASAETEEGLKAVIGRLRKRVDEDSRRLASLKADLNRERAGKAAVEIEEGVSDKKRQIKIEELKRELAAATKRLAELRKERDNLLQYKEAFLRYVRENREFIRSIGEDQ